METSLTREQKTIRICDHLISLSRSHNGGDFILNLEEISGVSEPDVRSIIKGLFTEYEEGHMGINIKSGLERDSFQVYITFGSGYLSGMGLNWVKIINPRIAALMAIKRRVCGDWFMNSKSEVRGAEVGRSGIASSPRGEKVAGAAPQNVAPQTDIIFRLEKTRRGLLVVYVPTGKSFVLCSPRFCSSGDELLEYAIKTKPNQQFGLEDAKKGGVTGINRPLAQIFDDLGFRGIIKKAFVRVSKKAVMVTVSLTMGDLIERGIEENELLKELQKPKKVTIPKGKKRK